MSSLTCAIFPGERKADASTSPSLSASRLSCRDPKERGSLIVLVDQFNLLQVEAGIVDQPRRFPAASVLRPKSCA